MAEREFYIGSVGPLTYNDSDTYPDGVAHAAVRARQIHISTAPTLNQHVLRLADLSGVIRGVSVADITNPTELASLSGTEGCLLVAYQSGAFRNHVTLYTWDVTTLTEDIPWVVLNSTSGSWIAIGGRYTSQQLVLRKSSSTNSPLTLPAGTLNSSPGNGDIEADSGDLYFTIGGTRYKVVLDTKTQTLSNKVVLGHLQTCFVDTSPGNVTNTTDETTVFTYTIPANSISAGQQFICKLRGRVQAYTGHTLTIYLKVGGTTLCYDTVSPKVGGYQGFEIDGTVTFRTSGASATVYGQLNGNLGINASGNIILISSTTSYGSGSRNTSGSLALAITAKWSGSSTSSNFGVQQGSLFKLA